MFQRYLSNVRGDHQDAAFQQGLALFTIVANLGSLEAQLPNLNVHHGQARLVWNARDVVVEPHDHLIEDHLGFNMVQRIDAAEFGARLARCAANEDLQYLVSAASGSLMSVDFRRAGARRFAVPPTIRSDPGRSPRHVPEHRPTRIGSLIIPGGCKPARKFG